MPLCITNDYPLALSVQRFYGDVFYGRCPVKALVEACDGAFCDREAERCTTDQLHVDQQQTEDSRTSVTENFAKAN